MSLIFIEVMFFEISKNKNPSKIIHYTVLLKEHYNIKACYCTMWIRIKQQKYK